MNEPMTPYEQAVFSYHRSWNRVPKTRTPFWLNRTPDDNNPFTKRRLDRVGFHPTVCKKKIASTPFKKPKASDKRRVAPVKLGFSERQHMFYSHIDN